MFLDFLLELFHQNRHNEAIVWQDKVCSYQWLLERVNHWQETLRVEEIESGTVTILEGDFSPDTIALFLALIKQGCIIAPLSKSVQAKRAEFIEIAQAEIGFFLNEDDQVEIERFPYSGEHMLYDQLRALKHPGLVLFSSGSTGKNKAAVHDLSRLLQKFQTKRRNFRTLTFLLFDHIGGIDTLFYSLSNGSCIITVDDRSPASVCKAIETHKVEVLPVSPTFLNLMILSEAYSRYDLSYPQIHHLWFRSNSLKQCWINA